MVSNFCIYKTKPRSNAIMNSPCMLGLNIDVFRSALHPPSLLAQVSLIVRSFIPVYDQRAIVEVTPKHHDQCDPHSGGAATELKQSDKRAAEETILFMISKKAAEENALVKKGNNIRGGKTLHMISPFAFADYCIKTNYQYSHVQYHLEAHS